MNSKNHLHLGRSCPIGADQEQNQIFQRNSFLTPDPGFPAQEPKIFLHLIPAGLARVRRWTRDQNEIGAGPDAVFLVAKNFPQNPFHAVPLHGIAGLAKHPYGDPDAGKVFGRTAQPDQGQISPGEAPALPQDLFDLPVEADFLLGLEFKGAP